MNKTSFFLYSFLLSLVLLIVPLATKAGYYVVDKVGDEMVVVNDGYSQYVIEYDYDCYESDFFEGDTIYIDSYYPSYGDIIVVQDYFGNKTCEVDDAEEVELESYFVETVLDDDDMIIVTDKYGDGYLVEYGIGCGIYMWRYEGKYIDIDIGGAFLDGISDRIYLLDNGKDCRVWEVTELSDGSSGGYSYDNTDYCAILFPNSYTNSSGNCACYQGYEWDTEQASCIKHIAVQCPQNAHYSETSGGCVCDDGYLYYSAGERCVDFNTACQIRYGNYTYGDAEYCYCEEGYQWNSAGTGCEEIPETEPTIIEEPVANRITDSGSDTSLLGGQYDPTKHDSSLVDRMKGRILLQTEEHGEAWYLHPDTGERYYMKDGPTAYQMMREFGLGITDVDLEKIPSVETQDEMLASGSVCGWNSTANRLKGKILLQVEQHGEAWYIHPDKCRRIYMKDGATAYTIMRYLSLGISNADLEKIPSESL